MDLSKDALVFGFAYLHHEGCTLQFGGEGAVKEITPRARKALDELLEAGAVEIGEPDTSIKGREYYKGKVAMGPLCKGVFDPLSDDIRWPTFVTKELTPKGSF